MFCRNNAALSRWKACVTPLGLSRYELYYFPTTLYHQSPVINTCVLQLNISSQLNLGPSKLSNHRSNIYVHSFTKT